MSSSNPLLEKFYEMFPEKKEKPKMPRIEDYEGEETIADELKKSKVIKAENSKIAIKGNQIGYSDKTNITITKPQKLTTYDPDDLEASFHQVAEQIQNGDAIVTNMSMEMDMMSRYSAGTKIIFEVYVHKF